MSVGHVRRIPELYIRLPVLQHLISLFALADVCVRSKRMLFPFNLLSKNFIQVSGARLKIQLGRWLRSGEVETYLGDGNVRRKYLCVGKQKIGNYRSNTSKGFYRIYGKIVTKLPPGSRT
jgi:hypothetical protein